MQDSFFARQFTDPFFNVVTLKFIQLAARTAPRQEYAQLSDTPLTGNDILTIVPSTNYNTHTAVISWPTGIAIYCGGMGVGMPQVPRLIRDWSNVPDWNGTYGFAPILATAGDMIIAAASLDLADNRPIYLYGHSFGGSTACYLAVKARRFNSSRRIQISTYGQFRPGQSVAQGSTYQQGLIRWWANGDPVRFIPPHADESPLLTVFNTTALISGANSQVQPPNGWRIDPSGVIQRDEGLVGFGTNVALDILQWCSGVAGFGSPAHDIQTYIDRFVDFLATPLPPEPPQTPPVREAPEFVNAAQLQQIRTRGEAQVVAALQQGNLPPVNVTVTQGQTFAPPILYTPPLRYKLKKLQGIWGVTYNGQCVAIGPGKRHAKTLRRQFNRTLLQGNR